MPGARELFVDTSALAALAISGDINHAAAAASFRHLMTEKATPLVTSHPVVLETTSLLQSRFGFAVARALHDRIMPVLVTVSVSSESFARAVAIWRAAQRRALSLVDCTSFEIMRDLGITTAFAYDPHFAEEGFEVLG